MANEGKQLWQNQLDYMERFMRELSQETDPQVAANLYGRGLREAGLFPTDGYLSISRRDLKFPEYRITRSSTWKENINPWNEKHRLPVFSTGLISELIYSNHPTIIEDLPARVMADDPAAEYFQGMNLLIAIPHYDNGEGINMGIMLARSSDKVPREMIPLVLLQANLWGRSVLNFVLRQELKRTVDALDHELKAVGEIQRSLLPVTLPRIEGLEVAAHYETSQRAGGDYYDFLPLPDGQWGILIADVSGHGTPAAVMMAVTHAIAYTRPMSGMPPGEFLAYLNQMLEKRYLGGTGSFVTAFYGIYDPKTHRMTYTSAGHPMPRLARDGEAVAMEGHGGLPLGIESDASYPEYQMKLHSGDRILAYTDGVSEAFDKSREQYGTDRLDAILLASRGDANSLLREVLDDLKRHGGDVPAADDRTLLAILVK